MATTNLMNEITIAYPNMTRAEKKVADIVLSRPQDLLHATINDLAKICNVGETSVFRFCRTLSLNGYQDFKLSLALSTSLPDCTQSKDTINLLNPPAAKILPEESFRFTKMRWIVHLDLFILMQSPEPLT